LAIVKPFRALRPLPQQVAAVASVPYDVVNSAEAAALAEGNPLSFLRVSRPEIELPAATDLYSDHVYQKAAANFDRLTAAAPLMIEDEPSLYVYRLVMNGREQTGLVACCSVDEYDAGTILRHELTRRDKEDDRTRHILTLRAQTGPVFLVYRAEPDIHQLTAQVAAGEPLFDFTAADGIRHTLWRVPIALNAAMSEAFSKVPKLYIADGHHRAKSASRAREALRANNAEHTGAEEYNFFQCVIFPDDQVKILPYNRVVKDLDGHTTDEFLKVVQYSFIITDDASPAPTAPGSYSMYLDGKWYGLKPGRISAGVGSVTENLDVSVLQNHLLSPLLGISDPRTDKRIDFVGGIRGTAELEMLVDSGKFAVAFSLYPTTLDDLMNVSDAGEIMPPKSTWFEPKLRDGILSHLI
jgi:uncharacterized protein (DUF1015 family)